MQFIHTNVESINCTALFKIVFCAYTVHVHVHVRSSYITTTASNANGMKALKCKTLGAEFATNYPFCI